MDRDQGLIHPSMFRLSEPSFRRLISLILKQGDFVVEMCKRLSTVVELVRKGSFDSVTFLVEKATEIEIVDLPKGSQTLLDMAGPCHAQP